MFKGGAGALNRRITLQLLPDPNGPKNDEGELTTPPVDDIADIAAAYESAGTRAFPEREKRYTETTGRFRIRYRPDINIQTLSETRRVSYVMDYNASPLVTRIFRISGADDPDGSRNEIHIEVSEVR